MTAIKKQIKEQQIDQIFFFSSTYMSPDRHVVSRSLCTCHGQGGKYRHPHPKGPQGTEDFKLK